MNSVRVMHLTDTLDAGGAERVAVNLVNLMPRGRYETHLCTTRREGALAELIAHDVGRLCLERKRRCDFGALRRLVAFIRTHHVDILHAHGTALLMANLASLFPPFPAVVWHDHFGRYAYEERPVWLYRLLMKRVRGVVAVNQSLVAWARNRLCVPPSRVWYIPNFVVQEQADGPPPDLPGSPGARIVCTANFRPQKDHPTLLHAMALVREQMPAAHLLLIGLGGDASYSASVQEVIQRLDLAGNVSILGERRDVPAILRASDIGVLSSASEGLPLSLLEYGTAGLPVVATEVGQCPEVLDFGRAGILVPPAAPAQLAEALLALLRSPQRRHSLGERLCRRVREVYSAGNALRQLGQVYDVVLNG